MLIFLRSFKILISLLTFTILSACTSPAKLTAAEKFATSFSKSIEAIDFIIADRADAERIDSSALSFSPVTSTNSALIPEFAKLACSTYSSKLMNVAYAKDELVAYQSLIEALAKDPKDSSLTGTIANILGNRKLVFEIESIEDFKNSAIKREEQCKFEVRAILQPPPNPASFIEWGGNPSTFLNAWPTLKGLLEFIATQADQQIRVTAIQKTLNDPENKARIDSALSTLRSSVDLKNSILLRRKEAIFLGFAYYARSQSSQDFISRHKDASKMNAAFNAYSKFVDINIEELINKMKASNLSFIERMNSTKVDSSDYIATLDYLSEALTKYTAAKKAIDEAKN